MVDGSYAISAKSPMGTQNSTITLLADDGKLSGNVVTGIDSSELINGVVNGENFEFEVEMKTPMGKIKPKFTGNVSGDTISGKMKVVFGSFDFEGTRV